MALRFAAVGLRSLPTTQFTYCVIAAGGGGGAQRVSVAGSSSSFSSFSTFTSTSATTSFSSYSSLLTLGGGAIPAVTAAAVVGLQQQQQQQQQQQVRFLSKRSRQKRRPNRNPKLSLVLLEDIPNLGVRGQCVDVRHGFGRNYLVPKGFAVYATPANIDAHAIPEAEAAAAARPSDRTDKVVRHMQEQGVKLHRNPGKAFNVTADDLVAACAHQLWLDVPVTRVALKAPITDYGQHRVSVAVDEGIDAELLVSVVGVAPK